MPRLWGISSGALLLLISRTVALLLSKMSSLFAEAILGGTGHLIKDLALLFAPVLLPREWSLQESISLINVYF
jgi:hypothetical protein